MRSVGIADGDFSDLGPLATAIGDARVVMLGEAGRASYRGFRSMGEVRSARLAFTE